MKLIEEADKNCEISLTVQGLDVRRAAELTAARFRRELGQMLRVIVEGLRPGKKPKTGRSA